MTKLFKSQYVTIGKKKKYAIELTMNFPTEGYARDEAKKIFSKIINNTLEVGAIRVKPEIKDYEGCWSCYFRFYPGKVKDYSKAKEFI